MGIRDLEAAVDFFLEAGLAETSRKVYQAGWRKYLAFCLSFARPPTPITQENATLFVAWLGTEGKALSTIESYLAALRFARLRLDPTATAVTFHSPHMNTLLRGIKRVRSQAGQLGRVRLPITGSIMRAIKKSLAQRPPDYDNRLLWAACCVGFFGFLRCGEFLVPDDATFTSETHLALTDISFTTQRGTQVFHINIKASKTDQFRSGALVVLAATASDICPVQALLDYLGQRGNQPGPLFLTSTWQPLHRRSFVTQVQQALQEAGIDGSMFNGHSFRIGAATTASSVGIPETIIQRLGRWQSSAYQGYIRPNPDDLVTVSRQLAQTS